MSVNRGRQPGQGSLIASLVLVTIGAAGLVGGLFTDSLTLIWISIAACLTAMVGLGFGVAARAQDSAGDSGGQQRVPAGARGRQARVPSSGEVDPYEVLGLRPSATRRQIRRAYRRRTRILDAEGQSGHRSTAETQAARVALDEAWQVLGDPRAREAYDLRRSR